MTQIYIFSANNNTSEDVKLNNLRHLCHLRLKKLSLCRFAE